MRNQPVRGTRDLIGKEAAAFRAIDHQAWQCAQSFGFQECVTPIFEFSEVFNKSLGEASDIVSKEMYTFLDKNQDSLTLRPEGTAAIARAFISNGLTKDLPLKLYYYGPMFRHERPQKGRYRQFYQVGVEMLGFATWHSDVEALSLASIFLDKLGLSKRCQLQINSIGDSESRKQYRQTLVEYFKRFESQLSMDSKERLEKNPLRILDSKDPKDQEIVAGAPKISTCFTKQAQEFFDSVQSGLQNLSIPFVVNEQLVRGLDYYTHTVFEFVTTDLGAQGALLAGGRYDGMIGSMGGPETPGIGWASGVDRLALMLMDNEMNSPLLQNSTHTLFANLIALVAADPLAETLCMKLAHSLRTKGFAAEVPVAGNMGKKLKRADKIGATQAWIIGETEIQNKTVSVKNLKTGEQKTMALSEACSSFGIEWS